MISQKNVSLGVIILGAGASSRMGRPKLLLPWGSMTVLGHIVRQWRALEVAQIAIVYRPGDAELSAELDRLDFPSQNRIENPEPERGMFSSVLCAASWDGWQKRLKAWAIVLGDQPHLSPETLPTLLACHREHPDAICQPIYDGRTRHPVILPHWAFDELKHSRVETLKEFLKRTSGPLVKCPIEDSGLALDLDRPKDYEKAIKFHLRDV